MASTSPHVFVVIGCGPGIGLATAKLFATQAFDKVALIARNESRLQDHRLAVLDAAKQKNKEVDINCWAVDLANRAALKTALAEVQNLGQVSCVLFNAARVGLSDLRDFDEDELMHDFLTSNVALHTTAKWAVPLLSRSGVQRPTFLVTNSLLWQAPLPPLFSLSMTKASQRNYVQSMQETFKDIHIALLYVAGQVSEDDQVRSPSLIAQKFLDIYNQDKASWAMEMEI